jgi:uncharacterized protein (TIGR03083 family)
MATGTRDAIAAMRRSHDDLVRFVQDLGADGLGRQSGAEKWAVADVLGHLGSAAEIGVSTLATGKADMGAARGTWARWDAMSPAEKASNYVSAEGHLVNAFEALDDEVLTDKKVDVGFLPAPVDVGFLCAMRLSEVGLHTWDIAVAFDPGATVPDVVVPFVLELLPQFAPFFGKPTGKTGRTAVETTGPARSYLLELRDDGTTLSEGPAGNSGTLVTLPAEALLRLTGGRLGPGRTPPTVRIQGELSLDDLRRAFPGY